MITPNEIADVTNRLGELLGEADTSPSATDRARSVALALHASCDLLTRITDDDLVLQYERVVREGNREALNIQRDLTGGAVELVSMEFGHFEGFLKREVQLLRRSGFDRALADMLSHQIQREIGQLRATPATGSLLEQAIAELRDYVCRQSDRTARALRRSRATRSLLFGFGGLGLISVNIGATGVLSAVGVGASAGIGGALLTQSVTTLGEELQHGSM